MKCQSCTENIPPQWIAAIKSNSCPNCGGNIMAEQDQELITELREALTKMEASAEGISGWLLSNYHLKKIGTAEPTEFFKKSERPNQYGNFKIPDNPMQQFQKRAGIAKVLDKRDSFKQIVAEIESGAIENQYGNGQAMTGDEIEMDEEDPEIAAAEYARDNFQSEAKAKVNSSWIISDSGGTGRPLSNTDVQNISNSLAERMTPNEDNVHPAIKQARLLRLQKQQDFANGQGGFRRGD